VVIGHKHCLADYTYSEFEALVEELLQAAGTSAWQDRLLEHFIDLVAHPDGSDLIYYSESEKEGRATQVIARIMAWRKTNGLPLLKDVPAWPGC
jgi:hypothetical protein